MIVRLGQVAPKYNFVDLFWWTYLLGPNVGQSVVTSWIFKYRHLMNIHDNGVAKSGEAVIRTFGRVSKKVKDMISNAACAAWVWKGKSSLSSVGD